jgi:hypothetical protein
MLKYMIAASAALILLCGAQANAQEYDEVVVTGVRAEAYENFAIPAISMVRRADAVLTSVEVSSDSRDAALRAREIRQTLEDMARRGRSGNVTMALKQDEVLRPFSVDLAMRLLAYGGRADSNSVEVQLRTTTQGPDDTLDAARERFETFVESVTTAGRAMVDYDDEDLQLTVVGIPQYRAPLLAAIVEDGRNIAASFGAGYRPELSGLENPVVWRKTGDLDLTLFITYSLAVVPVAGVQ